jgi:hypothetical protein
MKMKVQERIEQTSKRVLVSKFQSFISLPSTNFDVSFWLGCHTTTARRTVRVQRVPTRLAESQRSNAAGTVFDCDNNTYCKYIQYFSAPG